MKIQEEIIEGNKLIAEFIGMTFSHTAIDSHNYEQYSYDMPDYLSQKVYGFKGASCYLDDQQFYTSWDWLMPVVEKIEGWTLNLPNFISVQINTGFIKIEGTGEKIFRNVSFEKSKINAVWLAVIEFIKWYNQNK